MSKKIGFIGAGNMATAILGGMLKNNYTQPDNIYICDLDASKCKYFFDKGVNVSRDATSLTMLSDVVFLAVKPQNFDEVLRAVCDTDTQNKIFVSIAAGISTDYIKSFVGKDAKVVRVMPNTPLLLSKGASAICCTNNINTADFEYIKGIFALGGTVEILQEKHMNEIISVNGSSPAYIYLFAKAVVDYAVECGIDRDVALNLFCATLEGASAMMKKGDDDIDTLIKKVSSPGGTTLAAIDSFEKDGFYDSVKRAMSACTNRAEELGK